MERAVRNRPLSGFIVFEGLDGSGTTTQMQLLSERFTSTGIHPVTTCEPTLGPIGVTIRRYLSGDIPVQPRTLALLFAADRREHLYGPDGIISSLDAGTPVICDRYLFSSLAYQSIECGRDFVEALNGEYPLPELLLFLDVPVDTCQRRLEGRSRKEILEHRTYQERVLEEYRESFSRFPGTGMRIRSIDGNRPQEEVADEIWSAVKELPILRT